jgi:hypothetical protein
MQCSSTVRLALGAQLAHRPRRVEQLPGEVVVGVVGVDEPELDVVLRRDAAQRRQAARHPHGADGAEQHAVVVGVRVRRRLRARGLSTGPRCADAIAVGRRRDAVDDSAAVHSLGCGPPRPRPATHGIPMDFTIADVAAALAEGRDEERRAALEALAVSMLLVDLWRWRLAGVRAYTCKLRLNGRTDGGEDDQRDGAAA